MSFPRYPEYKTSNTDFIGQVPAHWKLERLKHCAEVFPSNVDKKSVDGQVPVKLCNYTDVYYNDTIGGELGFMLATATKEQAMRFELQQGDVVFTKDSESADDIGVAAYVSKRLPGVVYGYHLSIARANRAAIGEFLKQYFNSQETKSYFAVSANGLTRVGLGQYAVDNAPIALPTVDEQTQIARFLEHETAKIDALIREQERLIALLQEKRQAVISHAVTKGLDPNMPTKDSGVEWLGEVPEHWIISQLKFNTLDIQTGPFGSQLHAEDYVEDGIPLINPAHMIDGLIVPDPQVSVDDATWLRLKRHSLAAGDLILARRGELGRCAIISEEQDGWLCGTGSLKAKLTSQIEPEYAYLLISSKGVVSELSLESKGSTMQNLNTETLGRVKLPMPPLWEQKLILDYIHEVSGQYATLVSTAQSANKLITERRSALISAAVTGKIDVRGWQPPAEESAFFPEVLEAGVEVTA